jgi:multidrug/hemolysin transport system permease protein
MAPFSLLSHLKLLGIIAANSFTYATLMYLVAALVRSSGAWGGLGTVIGTLVGFLGGIYFPIGELSDGIAAIIKCIPVIHGSALFRQEMTAAVMADTFAGLPVEVADEVNRVMGMKVTVGEHVLTGAEELAILLVCGVVFLIAGAAAVRFSKKSDR